MEEQKNYYAIIPANVRYDKDLPANAKLLYGEITALCNEKGYCWATNDYFAQLYNVSKTSISKWISCLIQKEYIYSVIEYKDGTKEILNRYLSLVKYPIEEKLNRGIEEKLKDNNTYMNNTNEYIVVDNIYDFIEQNFGRTLSPIEYELVNQWKDTELTRYAIKQAILNGKYNLKYINAILMNYEKNHILTVQEAQEEEKRYKNSKNNVIEPEWLNKPIESREVTEEEEQAFLKEIASYE